MRTTKPRRFPLLAAIVVVCLPALAFGQELLDAETHLKFANPLPIPGPMAPTVPGGSDYEVSITQFEQSLGLRDPVTGAPLMTTVWGYNGSYPGATIEARRDVPVTVRWTNDLVDGFGDPLPHLLPVDTSIHWAMPMDWPESGVPVATHLHGGHSESASDGRPEQWFTPGFAQVGPKWDKQTLVYDNDQQSATLWYHDHALGITRLNVYAGLAGYYLLRDDWEDSLGLPSGEFEIPLAIQDRMFTADGELYYPSEPEEEGQPDPSVLPEFFGDFILVNGEAWPYLEVQPRKYRFRILNGSDSRFYDLWITSGPDKPAPDQNVGPQIFQIGTDSGLLDAPVALDRLTIGPGERADVVVSFLGFEDLTLLLRNNARAPFPMGEAVNPETVGQIMAFRVRSGPVVDDSVLPASLRPAPIEPLVQTGATRELLLFEGEDEYGRLEPMLGTISEGAMHFADPITENPTLNDVEVWEIYNSTEDAHPIHLHLVSFQILDRQRFKAQQDPLTGALSQVKKIGRRKPPLPNEDGWKDTAQMFPGEVTRVIAKFDRPGEYVWHCHILSHEDHDMMRPYEVLPEGIAIAGRTQAVADVELPESMRQEPRVGAVPAIVPGRAMIFDVAGRLVREMRGLEVRESLQSWDGRDARGGSVPAGVYFWRLHSGATSEQGKTVIVR